MTGSERTDDGGRGDGHHQGGCKGVISREEMVGVAVLVGERKGWQVRQGQVEGRLEDRDQLSRACPEPEPTCRLHLCVIDVPQTHVTSYSHALLVWPPPNASSYGTFRPIPITVFSDCCRNKCRYLIFNQYDRSTSSNQNATI